MALEDDFGSEIVGGFQAHVIFGGPQIDGEQRHPTSALLGAALLPLVEQESRKKVTTIFGEEAPISG